MAEELPTGTFGDAHPTPKPHTAPPRPWNALAQAQHRADLEAALDSWTYAEDTRAPHTTRHLHAVQDQPAA